MNFVEERRIGRFSIGTDMLRKDVEAVMAVMGNMIVVRCEQLQFQDTFEYIAYSPEFDIVPLGLEIPTYEGIISKKDDGAYSIRIIRSTAQPSYSNLGKCFGGIKYVKEDSNG